MLYPLLYMSVDLRETCQPCPVCVESRARLRERSAKTHEFLKGKACASEESDLPALSSMCGVKSQAATIRRPHGVEARQVEQGTFLLGAVEANGVKAVAPAVPDGNLLLGPAASDCHYVPLTVLMVAAVAQGCPCYCSIGLRRLSVKIFSQKTLSEGFLTAIMCRSLCQWWLQWLRDVHAAAACVCEHSQ